MIRCSEEFVYCIVHLKMLQEQINHSRACSCLSTIACLINVRKVRAFSNHVTLTPFKGHELISSLIKRFLKIHDLVLMLFRRCLKIQEQFIILTFENIVHILSS